jgi:3'-5' exoribonuclease
LIVSHHGELAYGSPKVPLFPEALLLHHLDNLDSKMECMRGLLDRDRQIEGMWTGYSTALDRSVLKKAKFLNAAQPDVLKSDAPQTAPASAPVPATAPPAQAKRPEPSASPFASKLVDALRTKP